MAPPDQRRDIRPASPKAGSALRPIWPNANGLLFRPESLEAHMPTASAIHVVLDAARYHTCPAVMDYVKTSRIKLHHLPPYSPNLNAIEPCWKIMHECVTDNRYYKTFKQFTEAILAFLNVTFPENVRLWSDRLSDNFRLLQSPILHV